MSATIPITLQPIPAPVAISSLTFDQLLTNICQYVSASIQQDVSFFQTVTADPTHQTTPIIYNITQRIFKQWDSGLGRYVAISQFEPGDVKETFVAGDVAQLGWITCDGRKISAVQGVSFTQVSVMEQLFGIGGSLPNIAPQNTTGLPAANAFSKIPISAVLPAANTIGGLPFSTDYNPGESQNLATNTETLRSSTDSLETTVAAIKTVSDTLLVALNGGTSVPLYVQVFVGYP